MEIKPPGLGQPPVDPSRRSQETGRKPGPGFDAGRPAEATVSPNLAGARAQFKKADLRDAGRLDQAVRASLHELLEKEFPEFGRAAETQKELLVDWMANDPILRGQIERRLGKILE